jgi:tetratricopeptide (TPR) repeat protein
MPGLQPGVHSIKAVKMDYEPYGPREELVTPGGESTVSVKITTLKKRKKAVLDEFEKGIDQYNKGTLDHYKKAAVHFKSALDQDPTFSKAAYFLGLSYNLLSDQENAKKMFKRAVDVDPDYLEARATYGGILLDLGDDDESIRQLDFVVRRDKLNKVAWTSLAAAQKNKSLFTDSISSAREAIELDRNYAEPHLWLAESLRLSEKHDLAVREYKEYLRLSNFDNGAAGKANYYILGFTLGIGRKKRANLTDVWKEMRSMTYFGLCDSERNLKHFGSAVEYCQRAAHYDPENPLVQYALGLAYTASAQDSGTIESLPAARTHFQELLRISPGFDEAEKVKRYIQRIDTVLAQNSPR